MSVGKLHLAKALRKQQTEEEKREELLAAISESAGVFNAHAKEVGDAIGAWQPGRQGNGKIYIEAPGLKRRGAGGGVRAP